MPKYIKIYKKALQPEFCQSLIAKYNSDKRVKKDPQPDYSTRTFLYTSDKKNWSDEIQKIEKISNGIVSQYFDYLGTPINAWSNDGFVMAKYKPNDTCVLHEDGQAVNSPLRYATLLYFLNTVPKGGETVFPHQNKSIQPEEGTAVMFPCMLTHPHEVLAPMSDRYILQTWIVDPEMFIISN